MVLDGEGSGKTLRILLCKGANEFLIDIFRLSRFFLFYRISIADFKYNLLFSDCCMWGILGDIGGNRWMWWEVI